MGSFRNRDRPGVRETKARVRPEQSSAGAPRVPEALDPFDALAADLDLGDVGALDAELLATALEFEAVDLELPPEPTLLDIPEPLDLAAEMAQWEADGLAALEALRANADPLVSADDALDLARLLQERMEAQECLRGGSVAAGTDRASKPKRRRGRRTNRGAP